jgi:uncharacterized protein YodC (DUF2158 family)
MAAPKTTGGRGLSAFDGHDKDPGPRFLPVTRALVAGDVVRLKSGGPAMTVVAAKDGEVFTKWLLADMHTPGLGSFPPDALLVQAPDKSEVAPGDNFPP